MAFIEEHSKIYKAIEEAILAIFNEEILLEDPFKTTEMVVEHINITVNLNDENGGIK